MVEMEKLSVMDKVCPMPVLMMRRKLTEMEKDQLLEIVGNYMPAKDNILRAVNSLGHEVIAVVEEIGSYRLVIKKK